MLTKNKPRTYLREPTFGYGWGGDACYSPTLLEVLTEWVDSINFFNDRTRFAPAVSFGVHLFSGIAFVFYWGEFCTLNSAVFFLMTVLGLAIINNTVWYHRFCTHRAFRFSHAFWPRLFLWLNPVGIREESFVIPHRIHHFLSDKVGDPYGPHLGRLGSYLATESQQKTDVSISYEEYERLKKSLAHICFVPNDFPGFQKTGSVENVYYYLCRTIVANLFWGWCSFQFGGPSFLMAWWAGLFFYTFLLRDFNWWGHGGNFRKEKKRGWEFHSHSGALNQHFYGFIAGEWHDNHHNYPLSANTAFLPGQIDLAFVVIRCLRLLGVVRTHKNLKRSFCGQINKTTQQK